MKKWILWLLALLILTVSGIYLLIPSKIAISRVTLANVTITAEFRWIDQEQKWAQWWRDEKGNPHKEGEAFTYNGLVFRLTGIQHNLAGIEVTQDGISLQSILHLYSISRDTTGAIWECAMPTGTNPLSRIAMNKKAAVISHTLEAVLANLSAFVSDPKNVYGISIRKTTIQDTTMLSALYTSNDYPSTAVLYGYLGTVEKSIDKQKGRATGYPLVNVSKTNNGSFETQVAIPTDRALAGDGKIFYRRMVPGNFLSAEVSGGPYAIQNAMIELDNYLKDYSKSMMAKPFQQLITNRITETDTSKWLTRIYIPVAL